MAKIQIHHQFKNETRVIDEFEPVNADHISLKIEELNETHPLPPGAQWMMCTEGSEFFVKTNG